LPRSRLHRLQRVDRMRSGLKAIKRAFDIAFTAVGRPCGRPALVPRNAWRWRYI